MSGCSYCAATLTFIVELWDYERGGSWRAYDVVKKHWGSSLADDFTGFDTEDQALAYFLGHIAKHPHDEIRIRQVAHGERILHTHIYGSRE